MTNNASNSYRLLLICENPSQTDELIHFLEQQNQIVFPIAVDALETHTVQQNPDVIVVVSDIPDAYLLDQLKKQAIPAVIFSKDARREKIHEAIQAGVASYVVDGFSLTRVLPIVEAAISRFHETCKLKQELETTKNDLAERKLIDRAKGLIMDQRNCKENEAYRILRTMAMDRKKRLGDIARDILEISKVFT